MSDPNYVEIVTAAFAATPELRNVLTGERLQVIDGSRNIIVTDHHSVFVKIARPGFDPSPTINEVRWARDTQRVTAPLLFDREIEHDGYVMTAWEYKPSLAVTIDDLSYDDVRELGKQARLISRENFAGKTITSADRRQSALAILDNPHTWKTTPGGDHVELLRKMVEQFITEDLDSGSRGTIHGDMYLWNVARYADGSIGWLDFEHTAHADPRWDAASASLTLRRSGRSDLWRVFCHSAEQDPLDPVIEQMELATATAVTVWMIEGGHSLEKILWRTESLIDSYLTGQMPERFRLR